MIEVVCEPLSEGHDLSKFDCGKEPLNNWLRSSALRGQVQLTGRTFVIRPRYDEYPFEQGEVLGYFTLSAHMVTRSEMDSMVSRSTVRSLPRHVGAILLAKLALDLRIAGQGMGKLLMGAAMQRCVIAAESAAAVFVVVDAIDDQAIAFYQRFDFKLIPDSNRLFRPLRSIAEEMMYA